jgi:hypothetical protein
MLHGIGDVWLAKRDLFLFSVVCGMFIAWAGYSKTLLTSQKEKTNMETTKVVLYVSGGVVQSALSNNKNVLLFVIDEDNLKAEGKTYQEIGLIWKREANDCKYHVD